MRINIYSIIASSFIIIFSLFYSFKDVSIAELLKALKSVQFVYLFITLLVVAMSHIVRAMRWHYLIASIKEVKTTNLISPLMIGFMGNMLPARVGEFIRAYLLSKMEHISFSASFATILLERLFDLILVVITLSYVLFFMSDVFTKGTGRSNDELLAYMINFGWISLMVCLLILLYSSFILYKKESMMHIVNICIKPLPHKLGEAIIRIVNSFNQGLTIIKNKRDFLLVILLTLLIFGLLAAAFYLLYLALGIDDQLPIISSLLILILTIDIFVALFPTPGFFGSFHAACILSLNGIFSIPKAIALSYSIVSWCALMGFTIIIGAIFAVKQNLRFSDFMMSKEKIK